MNLMRDDRANHIAITMDYHSHAMQRGGEVMWLRFRAWNLSLTG
jgi:hypothetical protein